MNKKRLPDWAITVPEIRKWAKSAGMDLLTNNTVQVLFRDMKDPIGSAVMRPMALHRDGHMLLGTFKVEKDGKYEYVIGPLYRSLSVFVIDIPVEFFSLIADNPAISYIEGERRAELRDRIALVEKKEWTAKPQRHSSSQAQLGWQSIFSRREKPLAQPSPSFFQRALGPVSR
jgi:hypothetical protein